MRSVKPLVAATVCYVLAAICVTSCSPTQQANLQKFNANAAVDLAQFNTAAAPVVKNLACLDATGAAISGPLLTASGNSSGALVGASGAAVAQAVCPPNTTAVVKP